MEILNKDINSRLSDWLKPFKRDYSTNYPGLPNNWLRDEDELIEKTAAMEPGDCLGYMWLAEYGLEKITGVEDPIHNSTSIEPLGNKIVIWDSQYLMFLSDNQKWEELAECPPRSP